MEHLKNHSLDHFDSDIFEQVLGFEGREEHNWRHTLVVKGWIAGQYFYWGCYFGYWLGC